MSRNAHFISFDGGDGCGKSTQLALTEQWLKAQGVPLFVTRQPGATALGSELRRLLLDNHWQPVPEAELLMFLADRAQHVREQLAPALAEGRWVLCDRYSDSTQAYQLAARRLQQHENLAAMLRFAECGYQPKLTLWFDLSPQKAVERMKKRMQYDRLDAESMAFHQRVHAAFAAMHAQHPQRIKRIDAGADIDGVQQQIRMTLQALLG